MPATVPLRLLASSARAPRQAERPGLLARLFAAIPRSRGFEGDRELIHRLGFTDVKLTDELERRMTEYFLRNPNLRL